MYSVQKNDSEQTEQDPTNNQSKYRVRARLLRVMSFLKYDMFIVIYILQNALLP